jgi:hypothetical protein
MLAIEGLQLLAADNDIDSEIRQLTQQLNKFGAHFRAVVLRVQIPEILRYREDCIIKGSARTLCWNCIPAARNWRRLLVVSEPINSKGW